MKTSLKIIQYQFEDRVQEIKGIFIANLFMVLLMIFPDLNRIESNVHVWACLLSGSIFLMMSLFYDWKSNSRNLFLLFLYLLIGGVEYAWVGLLEPLYPVYNGYSKGMFLDVLIQLIPIGYVMFRMILITPLLRIILVNNIKR